MNAYRMLWRDKLIAHFVNYVTTEVLSFDLIALPVCWMGCSLCCETCLTVLKIVVFSYMAPCSLVCNMHTSI